MLFFFLFKPQNKTFRSCHIINYLFMSAIFSAIHPFHHPSFIPRNFPLSLYTMNFHKNTLTRLCYWFMFRKGSKNRNLYNHKMHILWNIAKFSFWICKLYFGCTLLVIGSFGCGDDDNTIHKCETDRVILGVVSWVLFVIISLRYCRGYILRT